MKIFILSVLAALVLAVGAGAMMEGWFAQSADTAFSTPSARVGPGGTLEERQFSGANDGQRS
jgi:hypothetical protein